MPDDLLSGFGSDEETGPAASDAAAEDKAGAAAEPASAAPASAPADDPAPKEQPPGWLENMRRGQCESDL